MRIFEIYVVRAKAVAMKINNVAVTFTISRYLSCLVLLTLFFWVVINVLPNKEKEYFTGERRFFH